MDQSSIPPLGAGDLVCGWLFERRLVSAYRALEIYVLDLAQFGGPGDGSDGSDAPSVWRSWDGCTFREVLLQEAASLRYADDFESADATQRRFANGSRLFAALEPGGQVVAVSWVNPSHAYLRHVKRDQVPLRRGSVYLHGGATALAYRRRGIGSALRQYLADQLSHQGALRMVSAVFPDNAPALAWHAGNGLQRWGRITYLRWRGREIWWTHVTAYGRQHPQLLEGIRPGVVIA
jgi:GNAT superfamily N-acetyltransferase